MPGRKGSQKGSKDSGDKEKEHQDGSGARSVFATFWANASYKSFAKPHFRDTAGSGSRSDLEDETAGTGPGGRRNQGPRYDSEALPSLAGHQRSHSSGGSNNSSSSGSDSGRHEGHCHAPTDSELESGLATPLSPIATTQSLRIPHKRTPTGRFTVHQLLYVFGSHGIGAFVISGGINFAIAYAMYTRTDDPIDLFEFPNTLMGDFAVTTIMQTIITWMVEMVVVNRDLRHASVRPIGFVDEPVVNEASSPSAPMGSLSRRLPRMLVRALRWFLLLDAPKALRKRRGSIVRKLRYLVAQAVRAFVYSLLLFALLVGPTLGILMGLGVKQGGDWFYASRWTPEIYKLLLGGVLALLSSPVFAMYWMVKCGWNGGIHESVMINGNETR